VTPFIAPAALGRTATRQASTAGRETASQRRILDTAGSEAEPSEASGGLAGSPTSAIPDDAAFLVYLDNLRPIEALMLETPGPKISDTQWLDIIAEAVRWAHQFVYPCL
jgi:hypothetical protein